MPDIRNEIIDNLQVRGSVSGGNLGSLARAIRVAMTSATSGSNGVQVADNANLDMATNDFTLHWEGSLPDYTPSVRQRLFYKILSDVGYSLAVEAGGLLRLYRNATTFDSTVATGLTDGSYAKFTASVIRETATAAGSVTFYVNGVQLGTAVSITAAATATLDNAGVFVFSGTDTVRIASDTINAIIYNRALSAAEVLSLYNNGPALADLGASQTAVYTSDFSAGVDGWAANVGTTATGNVDGINGSDNWLRGQRTSTTGSVGLAKSIASGGFRYRVATKFFNPVGSPFSYAVIGNQNGPISGAVAQSIPAGAETDVVYTTPEFPSGSTDIRWIMANADGTAFGSATTSNPIYLKNVTFTRAGVTGWWDARDAQSDTGQILDSSGNKNHAMLPASGATVIGKPMSEARQVRWTNTWTGTNELQYIGGVNQAVLPAKAYIESIVGIVSGATVEDIIIGDGSDTDRYVTITTALAAGTVTFTLANRTTDGTNLKLTVDPDANATMSIIWTVTFRILE